MRIRSHLWLLVLVAVLPVAGIATGLVVSELRRTRAAVEDETRRIARATASALDLHLLSSTTTLVSLATSPLLDRDAAAFQQQLRAVQRAVHPEWSCIALVPAVGEPLFVLPPSCAVTGRDAGAEHVRLAFETGAPQASDVLPSRSGPGPAVELAVPVPRAGRVPLAFVVDWSPEVLAQILAEQPLPRHGVARVLDRARRPITGFPAGEWRAPEPPPDAERTGLEVMEIVRLLAGDDGPGYVAHARSAVTGWTVSVARPGFALEEPVRRALWGGIVTVAMLVGTLGLAAVLARRIAAPVRDLERAAAEVGRGQVPGRGRWTVAEVRAAGEALIAAAAARRYAEERVRAQAEEAERARRTLARRQQEAEELARVARLLTERLDVPTVAERIVGALLPLVAAESSTLWVRRDSESRIVLASAGRAREGFPPGHVLPNGLGLVGLAARKGEPAWSRDVFAEPGLEFPPDVRERIVASGVRALLAVPLRIGDEIIGVVTVAHAAPRPYADDEIRLVSAFADQAALALDNARRFDAESAARSRAEATAARAARLQAIGTALSRGLSRAEVTRIVVEQIMPALRADTCSVYLLSRDGSALELVTAGGPGGALGEWARLPLDRSAPLADAVREGRAWFQGRRAERDERYPQLRGIPTPHEAAAYVPLLLDDRAIGGLTIAFHDARPFEEDDRRFILTAAQQCAQALDRARLHEAERAARANAEAAQARSAFLAEASTLLASSLDDRTTLGRLARLSVPAVADWCVVYLRDREGHVHRAEVAYGDAEGGAAAAERLRESPIGGGLERHSLIPRVLEAGEAVLLAELGPADPEPRGAEGPTALGALAALHPRSAMFVPVGRGQVTFGAIGFFTAESGRRYQPADLVLAEDLARRVALSLENARLFQAAQTASRAKDEFLAMLGHELRNPLGALSNAVAVLDEIGWPRPEGARLGKIVRRQVRHLARLVDDLLDVSRVVAGRVSLERLTVDFREIVERALAVFRQSTLGAVHVLEVRAEPAVVYADPTRLAQVVNNLLENAAKYTPDGGRIEVDLGVAGPEAVLRVSDSGIGIPAELLPHVFEPFTQERQRLDRSRGGLGLGLTLVRRLVELHGGSVTAESAGPGRGSTFIVRLPVATAAPEPPASPPTSGPVPPMRVLVVEDHDDARESLRLLLERQRHQVVEAVDGVTGLERLLAERPEVALVDIGLPGLDGYALVRAARAAPGGEGFYLVAVTGYGQPEDRRLALEAGFDAHLVKPVRVDDLLIALAGATDRAASRGGAAETR